jgi:DNA-binding NarL/FixJ family response regulator
MITVLIADDHTIVRDGLRQILDEAGNISVIAEAEDGREVVDLVRKSKPDVVLLDISMPGRGGLDVLKDLAAMQPAPATLILTMHPEEHYAVRAVRAGASGYLTKASAADELVDAIRKVARGGRYVTASLGERLLLEFQRGGQQPMHETLSDREHQVMCLIARGMRVAEIANELSLSSKTVSTYRTRILKKLDLKSNADIVRYAIDEGFIS